MVSGNGFQVFHSIGTWSLFVRKCVLVYLRWLCVLRTIRELLGFVEIVRNIVLHDGSCIGAVGSGCVSDVFVGGGVRDMIKS